MKHIPASLLIMTFLAFGGSLAACRPAAVPVEPTSAQEIVTAKPKQPSLKEAAGEGTRQPTTSPLKTAPLEATKVFTATPPALPTLSPTITATALPWPSQEVIGYSGADQAIRAYQFGDGSHWFVALGAIHGAHECNTSELLEDFVSAITDEPILLPEETTLFIVPLINPDGCAMNTRTNGEGIDLNRNWQTDDWVADSEGPGGIMAGAGGQYPFSEPETTALSNWLLLLRDRPHDGALTVISYHSLVSPNGLVQPGYKDKGFPEPTARELAEAYAYASGYPYSPVWVGNYAITGEFIHWATENGIVAIDVELPDGNPADTIPAGREETHFETNLRSLLAVMRDYSAKLP